MARPLLVLALLAPLFTACVDPPPGGSADDDAVAQSEQAITAQSFWWDQTLGHPTRMISYSDGFCFPTEMTGHFAGQAEWVSVDLGSDDYWYIDGRSSQSGVGAAARCVPWSTFSTTASASYMRDETYVGGLVWGGATSDHQLTGFDYVCPLSVFSGELNGGGESATVTMETGEWSMVEHSGVSYQDNALSAGSLCINVGNSGDISYWGGDPTNLGQYRWSQGQAPVRMAPIASAECFLEGITGRFEGGGEAVKIVDGGDGWWYLTGTSQQVDVGATARCMDHVQPIEALVRDGGFEQQPSGALGWPWSAEGTAARGVDHGGGYSHSGGNDAWIWATSGWNADTEVVAVRPGVNYKLTAWTRTSNVQNNGYFGVRNPAGQILSETRFGATNDTTYTQRSVTFNSGSATWVRVYVGYWAPGSGSWLQIDDVAMARN